jgi:phage protein D
LTSDFTNLSNLDYFYFNMTQKKTISNKKAPKRAQRVDRVERVERSSSEDKKRGRSSSEEKEEESDQRDKKARRSNRNRPADTTKKTAPQKRKAAER